MNADLAPPSASRRLCALCAVSLLLAAGPAGAQGFAGLGQAAEGFEPVRPGPFAFPRDHGAHPGFRIEWWYVTANLKDAEGTDYGIQWTLFRSALSPGGTHPDGGWATPQAYLGHAALTTREAHYTAERLARGGIGQAGVTAMPFEAHIDDWRLAGPSLRDVTLTARGERFGYELEMTAGGPFVAQGDEGYSVKAADGMASRYYSQPFYEVHGTLMLPAGTQTRGNGNGNAPPAAIREVAVTGQAWLDREWSSQPLSPGQSGWDWFSLHFDDGTRLMTFRLRDETQDDFASATWIAADGTPTPYRGDAISLTPLAASTVAGREVPTQWRLTLPERGVDIEVAALNPQSWMDLGFSYWEGPVTATGSHAGMGYLEMTGYE
ncbi:lipocalin-like domain-containing protein [Profundibacterium mesophilum]|uniref:Secreted hydrolase-like protein n=1 Tax=Profundibacterium mesophilum KAUST100406-0324 TaxID=1037889 RepID=A0A921NRT5_9RHOB|nr:lipocalin-like domain-containing protein [Profundibacterium mesophilum]KAF0677572.1 Secreted hydrolase-like protein [Profundibacterium mesophilum KAUST100406-0324]